MLILNIFCLYDIVFKFLKNIYFFPLLFGGGVIKYTCKSVVDNRDT